MIRLATVNGARVIPKRTYARLADCDGPLFAEYQRAKDIWDQVRQSDGPEKVEARQAAIAAYDAWALSCGMAPINTPKSWGFN